ncbi:uncharacterized protein LOC124259928 [Haliotis rubra]|uniref:uncharacterized protein LOC124259928 n=1 Tax=Haliotis rubra TaxID=36100 RepID=UPI001EE57F2E|nr:uncharacterized protein LOC124259928 [Haliotis rubra]
MATEQNVLTMKEVTIRKLEITYKLWVTPDVYDRCQEAEPKTSPPLPRHRSLVDLPDVYTQTTTGENFLLAADGHQDKILIFATPENLRPLYEASIKYCDECPGSCICRNKQCVSCKENHYSPGSGCFATCSFTCKEKECNGVTGYCTHGCKDGWYGSDCGHICTGFCSRCNRETGFCEITSGSEEDGGSFLFPSKMFGFVFCFVVVLCVGALMVNCSKKQKKCSESRDDDSNDLEMWPSTQTQLHHSQDSVPSASVWHSGSYVLDADTPGWGEEEESEENEAIAQHSPSPQPAFQEPTQPPYHEPTQPPHREPAHPPYREPAQSPAHPAPSGQTDAPPAYSSLFPDTSSKH